MRPQGRTRQLRAARRGGWPLPMRQLRTAAPLAAATAAERPVLREELRGLKGEAATRRAAGALPLGPAAGMRSAPRLVLEALDAQVPWTARAKLSKGLQMVLGTLCIVWGRV